MKKIKKMKKQEKQKKVKDVTIEKENIEEERVKPKERSLSKSSTNGKIKRKSKNSCLRKVIWFFNNNISFNFVK